MTKHGSAMRLGALMLGVVLALTLAAPARAEALDVLTVAAIVGAAVVVVILVVYLVVASARDSRAAHEPRPVTVACVQSDGPLRNCWPLSEPGQPMEIEPAVVLLQPAPQS